MFASFDNILKVKDTSGCQKVATIYLYTQSKFVLKYDHEVNSECTEKLKFNILYDLFF